MNSVSKSTILSKYPAIGKLLDPMPEEIWEKCSVVSLKAGEKIFYQGEDVNKVYLICEGIVSVYENDLSGREMQVVFLNEGGTVGEMEVLTKEPSLRFSAKAISPTVLIQMSASTFLQWSKKNLEICHMIIEVLSKKVWQISNEVVLHVQSSAIEMLSARLVASEPGLVRVTRNELAQRCGVSIRTINRCVQKLAEEGFITIMHRKIYISKEQKDMLAESEYVNQMKASPQGI